MKRQEFLTALGGAAASPAIWPLAAQAQRRTLPTIGWLDSASPEAARESLPAFRQGLAENGYVEGKNITIEFRWGDGHYNRLPAFAAELVDV